MKSKWFWMLGLLCMFLLGILVSTLSRMVLLKRDEIVLAEDLRTLNCYYTCLTDPDIYLGDPISTSNDIVRVMEFFEKYPQTLCLVKGQQTSEDRVPVFIVLPTVNNQALGILWDFGMSEAFSPQSSGFSVRFSEMVKQLDNHQYIVGKWLCSTNRVMVLSTDKFLRRVMKDTGCRGPSRVGGDK